MDPSLLLNIAPYFPPLLRFLMRHRADITGIDELEGYEERFATSFEMSLKQELHQAVAVDDLVVKFESNRKDILASFKGENIGDPTTVIEIISENLTEFVAEEIDAENVDKDQIEPAVKKAYYSTLDDFSNEIKEDDRARFNNDINRAIQKELLNLKESVEELKDQHQSNQESRQGYEPFRIERTQEGMEALVTEEIAQELDHEGSFHAPPGFTTHDDEEFALLYGRKGSGKTRVLRETVSRLIDQQEFDAVIYVQQGYQEFDQFDSILQRQYDGDVLIVWDDAHVLDDRDVIGNTLLSIADYLDTSGDHDLWVRMTARRESLDAVVKPSHHPDSTHSQTFHADVTPSDTELGTLPVDTDEQFDSETISKLVAEALSANDLSDPHNLTDDFISAVLEYEPTPAYIESATRTIADNSNELKREHIEALPSSTVDSWTTAYAELRTSSQYGASRQAILKSVALLDWLNADVFATAIIRAICRETFDSTDDFQADLEYLESRGWLTVHDSPTRVEIHDIRLEAINTPIDDPSVIEGISTVLQGLTKDSVAVPAEVDDGYTSTLNSSFAAKLRDLNETALAEEHFRLAVRSGEPSPAIHTTYAEFLEDQDRPEEARVQRNTAQSMRENRSGDSFAFRKFKQQIEESLSEWDHEEVNRRGRTEKTDSMLEADANPSSADWTQEAYSKTDRHDQPPEPLTKQERAKSHAATERAIHQEMIKGIQDILQSQSYEAASPSADLFRELCRTDLEITNELIEKLQASETPTGVVTDIRLVRDIQSQRPYLDDSSSTPRVEQSTSEAYREVLNESFVEPSGPNSTADTEFLQILIELDSGLNKWLVFIEQEETVDIINTSADEAKRVMRDATSSDPIVEQLETKLAGNYSHVRQGPGAAMDELLLVNEAAFHTPPLVDTAKVYPQPAPTVPAVNSTIAIRTMVSELRAATKPVGNMGGVHSDEGVILPTGVQANRVCLCGKITEGQTTESDLWWAKLRDVFGDSILLYTKTYNQCGQNKITTAHPVLVTAVPKVIETDAGDKKVVLALRDIFNVDLESCLLTAVEVGTQTVDRIERFDDDLGFSEASRQEYDIESAADLPEYKETAERYTDFL